MPVSGPMTVKRLRECSFALLNRFPGFASDLHLQATCMLVHASSLRKPVPFTKVNLRTMSRG